MGLTDHAREVRYALTDPVKLCAALGLLDGSKRQATGLSICCPSHGEKDPSCSVTRGPDGTVRVRCFACDFSGDALHLIATVYGIGLRSDFRRVLAVGAEIAGALQLRDEILGGEALPERKPLPAPEPTEPVDYPPPDELQALWSQASSVSADADAWETLRARSIDPDGVDTNRLAKVAPEGAEWPRWARYQGRTWGQTGHRLLVPVFDATGAMRSVRAWRIIDGDTPKRLPPGGCRATGLVMANRFARGMLTGAVCPRRLIVVEGEPDWVTASLEWPDAVVGLISGAWGENFARRVPSGTEVILATHRDDAGERYAHGVAKTLGHRCAVWRAA